MQVLEAFRHGDEELLKAYPGEYSSVVFRSMQCHVQWAQYLQDVVPSLYQAHQGMHYCVVKM